LIGDYDIDRKEGVMKKGLNISRRLIAVLLAAAAAAAFPAGAGAASRDFHFPEVRVEIAVAADGSFLVDEYRTFEFRGAFHWATYWLPTSTLRLGRRADAAIEDWSVADESGALLRTDITRTADRFEAKWYFDARNERRTFHIRFRVRGVITRYADACELYWQAIGDGWDKSTGSAVVTVRLPSSAAGPDSLLVFGHGPLSGDCRIVDARTVRFTAANIPPRQFLEIRFLWPLGLTEGAPSSARTLASIRAEEESYVRRTIAQNIQRIETGNRRAAHVRFWVTLWLAGLILIPLAWLPFFIRAWRRAGKDYRFDDIPPYVHEPPSDLPPALMESLLRDGEVPTPRAFTATIFDLARRGVLRIEDVSTERHGFFGPKTSVETNLTLIRDYRPDASLASFEKAVLDLLFVEVAGREPGPGSRITLEELKKYLKRKAEKFQTWFQGWTKQVKAEGKARGFIEPGSLRMRNLFLAVTIPLGLVTMNIVLIVLSALLIPTLKRRAEPWARENELWKGLKRFLDDFSEFKDLPPEAYRLWERYLVCGIVFGNAKRILKSLPIVLRDERAAAPVWYMGYGQAAFLQSGGLEAMIGHLDSLSASITSAAHYSSGSGGGFSGGGGGGAGGGGGSAG
jgi:uncharacterized membrane protein